MSPDADPLDVAALEARLEALNADLARERTAIHDLETGGALALPKSGRRVAALLAYAALGAFLGFGFGFVLVAIRFFFSSGYGID